MSSPQSPTREGLAAENLARKQAAGRMGAALIMVPILLGLCILWAYVAYEYVFSKERLFSNNMIYPRMQGDAQKWLQGPLWGMMIMHAFLLLLSWKIGKNAGMAVLHDQRNPWGRGIGAMYLVVFPAALFTLPMLIVVSDGFDQLFQLLERHADLGMQVALFLAALSLIPALFLGLGYGYLLWRIRKRNGQAYAEIEIHTENPSPHSSESGI